ncbi:phosphate ABC transporter substrate-binding protein [Candidatus Desantisbacteria bacterium]|nr:phosphate ABC transporter substrate-binding protein [Candidatus Desantisbacteria bacterium]
MFKLIASMLISATIIGCGAKGNMNTETINIAGSTAFQPFAEKLAEGFMANNPGVRINVQGGGSAVGIQSVQTGVVQIGMADMVTLPKEAEGLKSIVAARDALVIIVHPDNKIDSLSSQQIQDIFSGKLNNWSQIGGEKKSITVVSREDGSGTRVSFNDLVLKGVSLGTHAIIQNSTGAVRLMVQNDPSAIGYITHGSLSPEVKTITIDGIAPSPQNIHAGKYSIVRPIFLLTKGEMKGKTSEFIDFILSSQGQKMLTDDGLLAVK